MLIRFVEIGYIIRIRIAGIAVDLRIRLMFARFWRWSDAEEGEEGKARSGALYLRKAGNHRAEPCKKNGELS